MTPEAGSAPPGRTRRKDMGVSVHNVWFTSDTHFSHTFVAKIRGFDTSDEHDEAMVEQWNSQVRPDDTVWHLGDVSISRSPARWTPWVSRLNGRKHLVSGNHDGTFVGHRQAYRDIAVYRQEFETVQSVARRKYNGVEFLLSHFPYDGDTNGRREDRYGQYRLRDCGVALVHGHTHGTSQRSESVLTGALQVHVGWDAWHRLVNQDEVGVMLVGGPVSAVSADTR